MSLNIMFVSCTSSNQEGFAEERQKEWSVPWTRTAWE